MLSARVGSCRGLSIRGHSRPELHQSVPIQLEPRRVWDVQPRARRGGPGCERSCGPVWDSTRRQRCDDSAKNGEAAARDRRMGPRRSRPTRPIGHRSARLSPTMRSRPFSARVRAMRRLHSSSGCGVTWTPRGPTTVERIGNWWLRTVPPVSAPTPAWPTAGPVERRRNSRARSSASLRPTPATPIGPLIPTPER